jgi:hypothetical protein
VSIEHFTQFGQRIEVGDVVGWGHRDGNMSRQQVGIVIELFDRDDHNHKTLRARCHWVAGGHKASYASATEARDLFVLDAASFDESVRHKLSMARRAQLPS